MSSISSDLDPQRKQEVLQSFYMNNFIKSEEKDKEIERLQKIIKVYEDRLLNHRKKESFRCFACKFVFFTDEELGMFCESCEEAYCSTCQFDYKTCEKCRVGMCDFCVKKEHICEDDLSDEE